MADQISGLPLNSSPNPLLSMVAIEAAGGVTQRAPMSQFIGTKVVIVNSQSDFPTATSGVRTLVTGTAYLVSDQFSMSDRIDVGVDTTIFGYGPRTSKITYTGSGTFLTVTDTSFIISRMGFDCASGTFMAADGSGAANKFVSLESTRLDSCIKCGTFDDISLNVQNFASVAHADGISFSGTIPFVLINGTSFVDSSAASKGIDLGTAVVTNFAMRDFLIAGTGIGLAGAAESANIVANAIGKVRDCDFSGITTKLSGIARDDFRWSFTGTRGILTSMRIAESDLGVIQLVTIATQSVFVRVNGTNWTDQVSESFTITTGGEITYIGEVDRTFIVTIIATVEKVGGGADIIEHRIGLDTGSGYTAVARTKSVTQNATPTTVISKGIFVSLSNGDKLASFVANNSGTTNINVTVSSFMVTQSATN